MFSQELLPQDAHLKETYPSLTISFFQTERKRLTGVNKINAQTQIFHPIFVCDIFHWLYNFRFLEINFIK